MTGNVLTISALFLQYITQPSDGIDICYELRCEPFLTYPRTYDLIIADHLLSYSHYNDKREGCLLEDIMLEMDRALCPQGFIIIRDDEFIVSRTKDLAPKFLWDVESHLLEDKQKKMERVLICRKKFWAIV
ncbi:hypothetical protein NE237_005230 [Protea cynaroides]|uniref:Methyltransferase n=1 Tax=Protea cynaroides TaxID=273540 RepID=A0A9Q0KKF3_9MAGN|nr:hypothetical protein NE237_005230 [Protea cynaroides]